VTLQYNITVQHCILALYPCSFFVEFTATSLTSCLIIVIIIIVIHITYVHKITQYKKAQQHTIQSNLHNNTHTFDHEIQESE